MLNWHNPSGEIIEIDISKYPNHTIFWLIFCFTNNVPVETETENRYYNDDIYTVRFLNWFNIVQKRYKQQLEIKTKNYIIDDNFIEFLKIYYNIKILNE